MEDLFEVKSFFNKKVTDVKRIVLDDAEKKKKRLYHKVKLMFRKILIAQDHLPPL